MGPQLGIIFLGTIAAKNIPRYIPLLRAENSSLPKANEALSKRRRAKRTRVQHGGSHSIQGAQDLLDQKAVDDQIIQETQQIVVVQSGLVRRHGAVASAASPGITCAPVKRL